MRTFNDLKIGDKLVLIYPECFVEEVITITDIEKCRGDINKNNVFIYFNHNDTDEGDHIQADLRRISDESNLWTDDQVDVVVIVPQSKSPLLW